MLKHTSGEVKGGRYPDQRTKYFWAYRYHKTSASCERGHGSCMFEPFCVSICLKPSYITKLHLLVVKYLQSSLVPSYLSHCWALYKHLCLCACMYPLIILLEHFSYSYWTLSRVFLVKTEHLWMLERFRVRACTERTSAFYHRCFPQLRISVPISQTAVHALLYLQVH